MGVRQLEEFLGQADQKGFWIFTYANLGGAFIGAFIGNSLMEMLAPPLKLPGILLGVLLGVMTTWKVKGHPIYRWALSYATFFLRRYLKIGLGDFTIDAGYYYRARTVKHEPFMLVATRDGKPVPVMVHRGSGDGSSADLFDGLFVPLVPPAVDGVWSSVPVARSSQSDSHDPTSPTEATPASSNGHSSHTPVSDEPLNSDYSDWNL